MVALLIGLQQRHQAALLIQRDQIVMPANMMVANKDLRHRAAPCALHHGGTRVGVLVDANFVELRHAALLQEPLGANAIGANSGGINSYWCHVLPDAMKLAVQTPEPSAHIQADAYAAVR